MTGQLVFTMISEHIGELLISQPKRRNALSAEMWASLPEFLVKAQEDRKLRVLIVRGDGDHFSAGADISEFETLYKTKESGAKISTSIASGLDALSNFPIPTIAQIRGACVGGGCAMALSCDIRFSDDQARFAITPAKLGLVYPFGDITRLIESIGISHAKDMIFSARLINAYRAEQIGLVNEVCQSDDLKDKVMDYASSVAALSPNSLKTMKKMTKAYQSGLRDDTAETEAWFLSGFTSDDFQAGYKAFLEKRKPEFS